MGTHLRIKRYADISVVELCSTFRVLGELAYGRQIVKFKDYYKITTEDNNVSLMKIVDNHALVSVVENAEEGSMVAKGFLYRRGYDWFLLTYQGKILNLGEFLGYFYARLEPHGKFMDVCFLDKTGKWVTKRYLNHYHVFCGKIIAIKRDDGLYDMLQAEDKLLRELTNTQVFVKEDDCFYKVYKRTMKNGVPGYMLLREGFNLNVSPGIWTVVKNNFARLFTALG